MKTPTTRAGAPQIKPAALRTFHARLGAWYRAHGRHDLPWRNTTEPYHIWLSEVMLQQTQVATVRDRFYFPFLKKFPSIEALAAAPQTEVLKAWEGLGYYSRARNLHKAAKRLVIEGGLAPFATQASLTPAASRLARSATHPSLEQLVALPGIGRNTASAILAFAYHQPVAILEANVKRVVARIFAYETSSDAELWAGAEQLLNPAEPFDYNQAMMDIGSLICTPKKPDCPSCPARGICRGKMAPEHYPARKAKKHVPLRHVDILVREDAAGNLFLEARDAKLLGGMYGFAQRPHPEFSQKKIQTSPKGEVKGGASSTKSQTVESDAIDATRATSPLGEVGAHLGASGEGVHLGEVTHTYSHFKLIGRVMYEKLNTRSNSGDWYSRAEIDLLPLSTLDHKILALVDRCHSAKKKSAKLSRARGKR